MTQNTRISSLVAPLAWLLLLCGLGHPLFAVVPQSSDQQITIEIQSLDKKERRIPITQVELLRVWEDSKEKKLLSIVEDSKPLSIVMILMMGSDPYCFLDYEQYLSFLNDSLEELLQPEDQVSLVVATKDAEMVLKFGDSVERRRALLGTRLSPRGELYHLNVKLGTEKRILAGKIFSASGNSVSENLLFTERKIIFQETNYILPAMQKGGDYLKISRKPGTRPVMVLCNSLYNLADPGRNKQIELEKRVNLGSIIVNWLGEPKEVLRHDGYYSAATSTRFRSQARKEEEAQWWHGRNDSRWQGREYYMSLIQQTGGIIKGCDPFDPDGKEKRRYPEFREMMSSLLTNLRTRYKITYESDNPDLTQPRNIKLEMSPKWKGGKVTLHYPKIIYPQAPEK